MQEIATETAVTERGAAAPAASGLRAQVETLERRLRQRDDQRRAMLHIMGDLNEFNKRLANQRKAMIHIMGDLRETTAEMQRREQELRDKQIGRAHV